MSKRSYDSMSCSEAGGSGPSDTVVAPAPKRFKQDFGLPLPTFRDPTPPGPAHVSSRKRALDEDDAGAQGESDIERRAAKRARTDARDPSTTEAWTLYRAVLKFYSRINALLRGFAVAREARVHTEGAAASLTAPEPLPSSACSNTSYPLGCRVQARLAFDMARFH
jgi:hypothetical protein